jgi:hypothetical protein
MPRPTLDYLALRRTNKPASGGKNYRVRERANYAPDTEADACEYRLKLNGLTQEELGQRWKRGEEQREREREQWRGYYAQPEAKKHAHRKLSEPEFNDLIGPQE